MNDKLLVQYGCGFSAPNGWRNFDASPTLMFERLPVVGKLYSRNAARFPKNVEYGNIVCGLPIADESAHAVYCSHILEHLSLQEFRISLKETYRMLTPSGVFRLVVPDLEAAIIGYVNNSSNSAALEFMSETKLGKEGRPRRLRSFIIDWLGNSQHLWMWDYKGLESELSNTGFRNIRRASYGDSFEVRFKEVENHDRWHNCLGIECIK